MVVVSKLNDDRARTAGAQSLAAMTPDLLALGRALSFCRARLGADVTALRISILLCVARNEGLSQRELLDRLDGVSTTALSRNLADLSALNVRKTKGLGLIALKGDPMNLRIKRVFLTAKGRRFVERLSREMATDGAKR